MDDGNAIEKGDGCQAGGYLDTKQGEEAIKRWLNNQLENTTVTVVLIKASTSNSNWVEYEIQQSYKRGNGMVSVYIHKLRNQNQSTDYKGDNPFDNLFLNGKPISELYSACDWVDNDGYNNFANWVEKAANNASK